MNVRVLTMGAAVVACAACAEASAPAAAVARIDDAGLPVVVRAEAGRIWWSRHEWTEPHDLWALPGHGPVEKLSVVREADGFVVTFEQSGTQWRGSFRTGSTSPRHGLKFGARQPAP